MFLFFAILALDLPAPSGESLFRIEDIRIEGVKNVAKDAILNKIKLSKGKMATPAAINEDIRAIYQIKYFNQVSAYRDGSVLIYSVSENDLIRSIRITGNSLDEDDLRKKILVKELDILDTRSLTSSVNELKKHYESQGYFLADVSYHINSVDGKADIEFKIKEGEKLKIKRIVFLGNNYFSDEELKKEFQTSEDTLFSFLSESGNFNEKLFSIDVERLNLFYRSKGFIQANIASPIVTVTPDKKWVFITVKINEGPMFSVNRIGFQGNTLFTDNELRNALVLNPEDTYSELSLQQDIQTLQLKYRDKGYAYANVGRFIEIEPGTNKVNINYIFEIGEIYRFGKVTITGNNHTRDKVIRREIKVMEGELFNGTAIKESEERVFRLGFFEPESVRFKTVPTDDDRIDIEVDVKERNTGQLSIGGGYSSTSGLFFKGQVSQNNFLGTGRSLNFSVLKAIRDSSLEIGLFDPYFLDSEWSGGFNVAHIDNSLEEYYGYRRNAFDFRIGHSIFTEDTRLYLTYSLEDTELYNIYDSTLNSNEENGIASLVRASLVHDRRNDRFDPTKGYYINFSNEYAGLLGNKQWFKSIFDLRYYHPIWGDLVFKYRLNAGYIGKIGGFAVPRVERFMMGGPQSLRGYYYNTVGPHKSGTNILTGNPQDFNQGGYAQFLTSFELEHPLNGPTMKWVVFADIGNVYNSFREFSELKLDYGVGIRLFMPIGIFRIEYGIPVGGGSPQFNLDIGQSF